MCIRRVQRWKLADDRSEPRESRDTESHAAAGHQVRFGHRARDEDDATPSGTSKEWPRSAKSIREGRHTTSTPTGSDREQRLKEGLEGISGIKDSRLPTLAPRKEVSPGQSSSRRVCPSPMESSDEEDDSYLGAARGRRAEVRSSSPKPWKTDEWRGWN
jgi:hypothetical protein